mmetsp:Transcript_1388/g.3206  ORF Transcript_1388/g.3206 Transcript_1388/m.3206 type:complete len:339 (+) Transcript_1388:1-1017(+)
MEEDIVARQRPAILRKLVKQGDPLYDGRILTKHETNMQRQKTRREDDDAFETAYRTFLVMSGEWTDPLRIAKLARKVRKNPEAKKRAIEMMRDWEIETKGYAPPHLQENEYTLQKLDPPIPYRVTKKYVKVYDREDRGDPDLDEVARLPRGSVVEVEGLHGKFAKVNRPYPGWIRVKHKRKKYPFIEPFPEHERTSDVVYGIPAKTRRPMPETMQKPWWETKRRKRLSDEERANLIEEHFYGDHEPKEGRRGWFRRQLHGDHSSEDSSVAKERKRLARSKTNFTWPPVYPPGEVPEVQQLTGSQRKLYEEIDRKAGNIEMRKEIGDVSMQSTDDMMEA